MYRPFGLNRRQALSSRGVSGGTLDSTNARWGPEERHFATADRVERRVLDDDEIVCGRSPAERSIRRRDVGNGQRRERLDRCEIARTELEPITVLRCDHEGEDGACGRPDGALRKRKLAGGDGRRRKRWCCRSSPERADDARDRQRGISVANGPRDVGDTSSVVRPGNADRSGGSFPNRVRICEPTQPLMISSKPPRPRVIKFAPAALGASLGSSIAVAGGSTRRVRRASVVASRARPTIAPDRAARRGPDVNCAAMTTTYAECGMSVATPEPSRAPSRGLDVGDQPEYGLR